MNIGKPVRTITVEPIVLPKPLRKPAPKEAPVFPKPEREPTPVRRK